MASPQLENGYTRVANELMEALATIRIPGEARQILDVIFRKTYGFGKSEDRISLSQFHLATGLVTPSVCRAIKKLLAINIIDVKPTSFGNVYSIKKDHEKWSGLTKTLVYENANNPLLFSKSRLTKTLDTKETLTKENNKRKMIPKKNNKLEGHVSVKDLTDVHVVMEAFEPVNVHAYRLHEQTKQYDASLRVLKIHGLKNLLEVIKNLPKTNEMEFFPRIFTPVQLEEKWEMLHHAWKDYTRKKIKNAPKVFFS